MSDEVKTEDGSYTLFSKEYNQHYHNINDGAIFESLSKHIIPCITYHKNKKNLNILDICFGLGYNTLSTIYYIKKSNLDIKLNIFSPELDKNLIESLKNFQYPKEFQTLKEIILHLLDKKEYKSDNLNIELYIGDARDYIKSFENKFFDIVYQDAFSSDVNVELWTKEYFKQIERVCGDDAILSTYSIATPVRLSLYESGFTIYEYIPKIRKSTLCFKKRQNILGKYIDMELKKLRNPNAKSIKDKI